MRQSRLFTKTLKNAPKEEVSINAQFLIRGGFIEKTGAGIYTYLPLGKRVLSKIETIIRQEMDAIDGQEILMPALHPKEYWDKTGRWESFGALFKLIGHGDKDFALGATHEEIVTPTAQKFIFSYKDMPKSVYQIQTKFRNEPRAKSGVLRGREFSMKDMYSFHTDQENVDTYYDVVAEAYEKVYVRCGIGEQTLMTYASGGAFSKYSHEFQTLSETGEDTIFVCESCKKAVNQEILEEVKQSCPECGNNSLQEKNAIEVGNIFKLGTRFSDAFKFTYASEEGAEKPVHMACFGLGPSRVMGTIVEVHHDENGIIWPQEVAPYHVHLVSLCKDEKDVEKADALYKKLTEKGIEVLYDDRPDARAGEKFADSDLIGIPTRLVISPKTIEKDSVEIKERTSSESSLVLLTDIAARLSDA